MQVKLTSAARLFDTNYSTHYDAVIIPAGMTYLTPFYARRKVNQQWYALYAYGFQDKGERASVSYGDPHGRSERQGVIDIVGGNTLVMTRPTDHGGGWALYELVENCPEQIDAYPLPVDARRIAFLGYTEDRTKRLVVVVSQFYDGHVNVYAGSSFDSMLTPTEAVEGTPETTEGGALFALEDGSEMLISLNTGLPCVYNKEQYYPVDPAAYTVEETLGGAALRRTQ